ncbi:MULTISPECIES: hypothetical protein [Pseudomonas]|jgi:hypothetical protein|uniref:hypothetical protein n=1 Tax=Pseudomonas TaxID=286 RepID=UPI0008119B6E|nr:MULTISPECIES: hypothetical protein [Pseudomonas]ATR82636.1 hypothetical protein CS390_08725 [Pseudomonas sp. HLS-6]
MLIELEKDTPTSRWLVHLDTWVVAFRSEAEATCFVQRLEDRIKAPHVLPPCAPPTRWHGTSSSPAPRQRITHPLHVDFQR